MNGTTLPTSGSSPSRIFRKFTHEVGFVILKEAAINTQSETRFGKAIKRFPNLWATYGIFLIGYGRKIDES